MKSRLLSPPKITFGITEACPLKCEHCYANCAATPKPGELELEDWLRVSDEVIADGVIQIYFEGGEPLAKPGILELLTRCGRDAMTLLRTHGTLIDEAMAEALVKANLGRVLVDLMGPDAVSHDASTGTPGSFEAACNAIRRCVTHGLPADVLTILTRHTAPHLNAIGRLAADLGATRLGVLRLYPLGRAKLIWRETALSLEEQMAAIRTLELPHGVTAMQSWHPHDRNCCWQAAAIDAFGRVIGCMYLREYVDFGRIGERRHIDIWRSHPLYRGLRSGHVESVSQAESEQGLQTGGCRSSAYAFHGRWTAPDPFDETLNAGMDLRALPKRTIRA